LLEFTCSARDSFYGGKLRALTGNWREEHLFVLSQALAMFDSLAERILECDAKTEALLVPPVRHDVELAGPDKKRHKSTPRFDVRAARALGGRGPHAHQRPVRGNHDDNRPRDRPGP
jgi:hypothetical protein